MKKEKLGTIIVIAGPTGVGESSVSKGIIKTIPNTERLVTTTTRKKRKNEVNGKDYHFISKTEFKKRIKKGYFLEYTHIKNRDDYYGTNRSDITKKINKGTNLIINLDAVGTQAMKKNFKKVITIFLIPDKFSNLVKRLTGRNPNISKKILEKRIINAREEIAREKKYYDHVVTNPQDKLDKTIEKITKLIKKQA